MMMWVAATGGEGMPEMGEQRDKHSVSDKRDQRGLQSWGT